jgi:hypothetical protein
MSAERLVFGLSSDAQPAINLPGVTFTLEHTVKRVPEMHVNARGLYSALKLLLTINIKPCTLKNP